MPLADQAKKQKSHHLYNYHPLMLCVADAGLLMHLLQNIAILTYAMICY